MNFNYLKTETYNDSIDIEHIGNCTIVVNNDEAEEWYIDIHTDYGWSKVRQFGPLDIDKGEVGNYFSFILNGFEYNEKRLYKVINDFLNNPKHAITQVEEISREDFENRLNALQSTI